MNKKAFTLIELMGVITVLGLISLLIAPTIVNQIRNSKNKIDEVTEKLIYAATDLYLENKKNDFPNYNGSVYCIKIGDLVNDGKLSNPVLDSSGNEISLDQIVEVDIIDHKYNYRMTSSCESFSAKYALRNLAVTSTQLNVDSIASCLTDGKECTPGTAFAIKVNEEKIYKFYVISDDNSKVTLIMDRNLGNRVAWITQDDYNDDTNYGTYGNNNRGPITTLSYLNVQTANWDNIEPIESYTYDNNLNGTTNTYGYQKLEIINGVGKLTSQDGLIISEVEGITKARLLTYEEVNNLEIANNDTIPTYLYGNLSSSNTIELPYSYWLLTAYPSNSNDARIVYYNKGVNIGFTRNETQVGIRPVIEVVK